MDTNKSTKKSERVIVPNKLGALFIFVLIIEGCSSSQHSRISNDQILEQRKKEYEHVTELIGQGSIKFLGGNGSSMERAIVVDGAKGEREGVAAEYIYISNEKGVRNRDWKLTAQSELVENKKEYDYLNIQSLKDSSVTDFYFDITGFYGK